MEHPGKEIERALGRIGAGQIALAYDTGYTTRHINKLVRGTALITAEFALALEKHLPPYEPAEYWMELDSKYRLHLAREKLRQNKDIK